MRRILGALTAAAALAVAGQAAAQGYLGGSIGQSDYDEGVAGGLITSGQVDGKDNGFKIFGGYMFQPNFGVELAYVDLGAASYSGDFFGAPVTGGKVEATGLNISALGRLPLSGAFSLFGKIGLFMWEADASDITGGVPFSDSADGNDLSFGVGLAYDFTRNLGARVEWERFDADGDVGLLSLGLAYRF
jgi:OOP family OmpA-OmpF porin